MQNFILLLSAIILFISIVLSYVSKRSSPNYDSNLDGFLLGGRSLNKISVVNLLLSSSFGVNAIFYAAWLGYTIGGWAIFIQVFWGLSFIWLSKYSSSFKNIDSLHDFLGKQFGKKTKIIASLCSIIGIMVFVGWEVGISEGAFTSIMQTNANSGSTTYITLSIFIGTLLYTIIGGIRGNAHVNIILNSMKILIVLVFIVFVGYSLTAITGEFSINNFFPPLAKTISDFGIWGLITNIVFNITWQFVDNSSWQSIISGRPSNVNWNLKGSGIYIFLSIGLFGTILGALLIGANDVNPDNILLKATEFSADISNVSIYLLVILLVTCVISLLDGMFLTIGLTISKDLEKTNNLRTIKYLMLPLIGILSIYGTKLIQNLFGIDLFDLVYIVVISQLALFGPVYIGLKYNGKSRQMWIPIFGGLSTGILAVILTWQTESSFYLEGAGTFSLMASLLLALIVKFYDKKI